MSNNKRLTRYKKGRKSSQTKPHLYDYHYNQPGTMPGLITIDENAVATEIFLVNYNSQQATRVNNLLPQDCLKYLSNDSISWIDIVGLGNEDKLQELGEIFHLHPLTLEDIVSIPQRPKVEECENYLLIIVPMAILIDHQGFLLEQISLIVGKNYVLTVQEEGQYDSLEGVRERIRLNKGSIRQQKSGYLAYAIWDAIIDGYFPVLESYGERIEELENKIFHVRPVSWFSRCFTSGQVLRYSTMEKEFISLTMAILNFADYIEAAPMTFVLTDSQPVLGNDLIKPEIKRTFNPKIIHLLQFIPRSDAYVKTVREHLKKFLTNVKAKIYFIDDPYRHLSCCPAHAHSHPYFNL